MKKPYIQPALHTETLLPMTGILADASVAGGLEGAGSDAEELVNEQTPNTDVWGEW